MKDLICAFCELIEYGWDIDIAELEDVIHWLELGWVKDGEPTDLGMEVYNTYWSEVTL